MIRKGPMFVDGTRPLPMMSKEHRWECEENEFQDTRAEESPGKWAEIL